MMAIQDYKVMPKYLFWVATVNLVSTVHLTIYFALTQLISSPVIIFKSFSSQAVLCNFLTAEAQSSVSFTPDLLQFTKSLFGFGWKGP